jgi:hypothetical protein
MAIASRVLGWLSCLGCLLGRGCLACCRLLYFFFFLLQYTSNELCCPVWAMEDSSFGPDWLVIIWGNYLSPDEECPIVWKSTSEKAEPEEDEAS